MTPLKQIGSVLPARLAAAALALLILAIPLTAFGQTVLSVEPPAPTESDFVHVRIVGQGGAGARVTAITRLPNGRIDIRVEGVCFSVPLPFDLRAAVGFLPAGDYVALLSSICMGSATPHAFHVSPGAAPDPATIPAASGMALLLTGVAVAAAALLKLRRSRNPKEDEPTT